MARKAKVVVPSVELIEVTESEVVSEATELTPVATESVVSSLVSQLVQTTPAPATEAKEKNVGVGTFIKALITEGLGNKEILAIVHEQYGNAQTTYACVAWYRNKMKKTSVVAAKNSALDFVTRFAQMAGASEGEVELVKSELKMVA